MTILSKTAAIVAISLGTSFAAFANTYTYQNEQVELAFKGDNIVAKHCAVKDGVVAEGSCREKSRNISELSEVLEARVAEGEKLLADPKALMAEAEKFAKNNDSPRISDQTTGKKYVMIPVTEGMTLPFDMDLAVEGDYTLVVEALKANVDRYKRALKHIESGKLPASVTTEKYSEVSGMLELQNVVEYGG